MMNTRPITDSMGENGLPSPWGLRDLRPTRVDPKCFWMYRAIRTNVLGHARNP